MFRITEVFCPTLIRPDDGKHAMEIVVGESIFRRVPSCWRSPENLSDVDNCMTRHGKCKARLPRRRLTHADYYQRAGVEYRRHRCQPRLIVMLRTEVTKDGVREMALH